MVVARSGVIAPLVAVAGVPPLRVQIAATAALSVTASGARERAGFACSGVCGRRGRARTQASHAR